VPCHGERKQRVGGAAFEGNVSSHVEKEIALNAALIKAIGLKPE
jgi:hypothetical protein